MTFPFPDQWEDDVALRKAGSEYHDFRAQLMVRNAEGMTATYNRFHDPHENDTEMQELRRLHAAMDRAVLDAYGWTDIPVTCSFLAGRGRGNEADSSQKGSYRYRWRDSVRDEVLARLLELNGQYAGE